MLVLINHEVVASKRHLGLHMNAVLGVIDDLRPKIARILIGNHLLIIYVHLHSIVGLTLTTGSQVRATTVSELLHLLLLHLILLSVSVPGR